MRAAHASLATVHEDREVASVLVDTAAVLAARDFSPAPRSGLSVHWPCIFFLVHRICLSGVAMNQLAIRYIFADLEDMVAFPDSEAFLQVCD